MAKKSPENASPVAQFEQSLESLEQLVEQMETGELAFNTVAPAREQGLSRHGWAGRTVRPLPAGLDR